MSLDYHRGLRVRDPMVVGLRIYMQSVHIITNIVSSYPLIRGVLDATLCDKVCESLAAGQWFSPGTPPIKLTGDTTEILLKVVLNTITLSLYFHRRKRIKCISRRCSLGATVNHILPTRCMAFSTQDTHKYAPS